MPKLFFITILSLFTLLLTAQVDSISMNISENTNVYKKNILSTIKITLEKKINQININTPYPIKGINIIIKGRGNRIIIEQKNITIDKSYSIIFSEHEEIKYYTIILQKENHLLAERLQKYWR